MIIKKNGKKNNYAIVMLSDLHELIWNSMKKFIKKECRGSYSLLW